MTSRAGLALLTTALSLCLGLLLPACSDDGAASPSPDDRSSQTSSSEVGGAEPDTDDIPFALFEGNVPAEGWRLSEAVQPSAEGLEMFGEMTPGMTWFAEWDGPDAADSAYVSLTMRRLALADLNAREPLARPQSGEIQGRQASWGDDSENVDDASGIVRIAWGGAWTLELRGSESVGTLRTFAERLRSATVTQWKAAGGQVGCTPFAEECDG